MKEDTTKEQEMSYDADVEMNDCNLKNRKIKKKPNNIEIELLTVLLEGLDTTKPKRYNMRKRNTKNKKTQNKVKTQTKLPRKKKGNKCGKKVKCKTKNVPSIVEMDVTMMFENLSV